MVGEAVLAACTLSVALLLAGCEPDERVAQTQDTDTTTSPTGAPIVEPSTTSQPAATTTRATTTTIPPTTPPPSTVPPTVATAPPPPPTVAPAGNCDPNYSGCVPIASDVDCAGGSGNGPAYVDGPVQIIGSDIYDLDRDNDGLGCED